MDCFAKELTPEHIPEGLWREVAETIGAENLYKLAELIGGATLYIPKPESLTRPIWTIWRMAATSSSATRRSTPTMSTARTASSN